MDLKKISDEELMLIINNTKDLELLELAEEEYVNRVCNNEIRQEAEEEIYELMKEHFRAN